MNSLLRLKITQCRLLGMKDTDSNGLKKLKRQLEIRRSGAAGPHKGPNDYRRKPKYPHEKFK